MHRLPFEDNHFEYLTLMNSLTYASEPQVVLNEASRVLSFGGRLVGTTLASHKHEELVSQYNHIQMGFEAEKLSKMLSLAGFKVDLCSMSCRERRTPYFEIITFYATQQNEGNQHG